MTRTLHIYGLLGMGIILVTLGFAAMNEEERRADAALTLRAEAIIAAGDLYAYHCAACHGGGGEGIAANPPLDSEAVRGMDAESLYKTIARGRYNTTMAAFAADEGGVLTPHDIENLMTLIQYGSWTYVAGVVADLGLTPPDAITLEITDAVLTALEELPNSENLSLGLTLYAENCVACHGANMEGTALAPALSPATLVYTDMTRIITQGVAGTLMAGWDRQLSDAELNALLELITRWEEIQYAGIEMPVVEAQPIDMSPAAVAEGERLYSLLCTQCHGTVGYGTPLAPALNNLTFLSQTPDAVIGQIIARGVTGTTMPAWGGYLNDANIAALTAYLRSWEPTAPPMATQ